MSYPNIVYVLADDLGYGDLRCLNPQSQIPTPHLDRLAANGMVFSDAHATSPVCTPSRYSLLTGQYNWRSRLQQGVLRRWDGPLLERTDVTVADFLRHHGYHTACIGKWHLGWDWTTRDGRPPNDSLPYADPSPEAEELRDEFWPQIDFSAPIGGGPVAHGFDSYFGVDVPNFPPYTWFIDDRLAELPTVPKPDDLYGDSGPAVEGWSHQAMLPAFTERAVDYIETHAAGREAAGQPFFLFLSLTAPHSPVAPNAEFGGRSGIGAYGDFVCEIDEMVGQLLDALERTGLVENTMVIFSSDNGPELDTYDDEGAYERARRSRHFSMGELRGVKRDSWDGGHRVPLILTWPRVVPARSHCTELVSLMDLTATCAEAIGEPLPTGAGKDSVSMLPLLSGASGPTRDEHVVHSYSGVLSIRVGDWVLIDGPGAENPEPGWLAEERGYESQAELGELYNLRSDPGERTNQYAAEPDRVADLRMRLATTAAPDPDR